jgi:uncharacterized protein YbjT (DUF2867 family)
VDELLAQGKHNVRVLSRKESPELTARGVDVRVVDYTQQSQVEDAVKGAHTVLCTIYMTGTGLNGPNFNAQSALIDASVKNGVKRFAPSEYGR